MELEGKGTKPTGQWKAAKQVAVDKENSHPVATSNQPKPRPTGKPKVTQESALGEEEGNKGAAIVVEALLAIQKGSPAPAQLHMSSPVVCTSQQVTPDCEDSHGSLEMGLDDEQNIEQDGQESSDEDGGCKGNSQIPPSHNTH